MQYLAPPKPGIRRRAGVIGPEDYMGPLGGKLALAFAAGCSLTFLFCVGLGRWLMGQLVKAKDDQMALLIKRIEHLEQDRAEEREDHARQIAALNDRIRVLEALTIGQVRGATQAAISELQNEVRGNVPEAPRPRRVRKGSEPK